MLSRIKLEILKKISQNPIHGYKLSKELNKSISSIYKHLNELLELNFIEILKEEESKKIYCITQKGKHILDLFK